jgi:UDP-N-acetylglucosamine--N-acetylmuramyl-(pentapeptide) pyrophosphoryl-undecaprenol N-acetylglucosamine transferase
VAALRAIFAGGGTGGHLFPAIAIADELKMLQTDAAMLFVGTKGKIEARVVPQQGYEFRTIWISGFHRSFRIGNLLFPLKVIVSTMQAISIIKKFRPEVVIGTGGYVSGPALYAATLLKVPTLIQEQNSYPGVTTRLLAKRVNEVHLTFEQSRKYLQRKDNIFVTGNPTRHDLDNVNITDAIEYFGFDSKTANKTILIFGGSLGAHTINLAVMKNIEQLLKHNFSIIWQTGKEDAEEAQNIFSKYPSTQVWINSFINRMDYAYAISDLVVCRAGATTIAELTRLGKPAILVPYPSAAANHQVENAASLVECGAAELLYDNEVSEKLSATIMSLVHENRLKQMSEQSKNLGKPNAAREIALRVINLAKNKNILV